MNDIPQQPIEVARFLIIGGEKGGVGKSSLSILDRSRIPDSLRLTHHPRRHKRPKRRHRRRR